MYMLRDTAKADASAISTRVSIVEASVRSEDTGIKAVFLLHGQAKSPAWFDGIQQIADFDVAPEIAISRSLGAVLLVEAEGRVIAVTFGTGFHALRPSLIERGFGLRVTANMVEPTKIRGGQTRGVARVSRDQKTLLPVNSEFAELGVEVDEDWLRQLSGKAANPGFASAISGADSLTLSIPNFSFREVASKVVEVVAAWRAETYKEEFPFLDQIVPIDRSDPIISQLNALAAAQVRGGDESLAFAAPDPFEQSDIDHFELTCQYSRYEIAELDTKAVLDIAAKLPPSKDPLEDIRVHAVDESGQDIDRVYPLKSYVQTEVSHDGENYLLSAGLWFSIRKDFVSEIEGRIADVPDLTELLDLPEWDSEALREDDKDPTAEGSYNILVAAARGYANLDKDLVYFGRYEKIEICDLLTPDALLLCVKTASDSPTLSHLVAQATTSAAAWGSEKYQDKLKDAWSTVSAEPVPSSAESTFVLAIATTKPGRLSDSLFFFSKVQIALGRDQVERGQLGFAVAKIQMKSIQPNKKKRTRKPQFKNDA